MVRSQPNEKFALWQSDQLRGEQDEASELDWVVSCRKCSGGQNDGPVVAQGQGNRIGAAQDGYREGLNALYFVPQGIDGQYE